MPYYIGDLKKDPNLENYPRRYVVWVWDWGLRGLEFWGAGFGELEALVGFVAMGGGV